MKKQKKLNLGKIKIAGINNVDSLLGGVTTNTQTCTQVETCVCWQTNPCYTDECNTSPADCPTTLQTRTASDACGAGEESLFGEIC